MILRFRLLIAVEQSQPAACRAIRMRNQNHVAGRMQLTSEPELVEGEGTLCFLAWGRQGFGAAGNPDNVYLNEPAPLQELIHCHRKAAVEAIDDSRIRPVKATF